MAFGIVVDPEEPGFFASGSLYQRCLELLPVFRISPCADPAGSAGVLSTPGRYSGAVIAGVDGAAHASRAPEPATSGNSTGAASAPGEPAERPAPLAARKTFSVAASPGDRGHRPEQSAGGQPANVIHPVLA